MIHPTSLLRALLQALAERRVAVGALAGVILVLGALTLYQMPVQLLPEIQYPQIRVIGDLPGYTSSIIEEAINEPMEAALAGTPGVVRLESRSGDGRAYLDLFFEPGYDLDRALRDVTQASQRARSQIPDEFPEPRIFAVSTVEQPALQIAFQSSTHSAPEIRRRLRSSVIPRLRGITGVDAVYIGREEVPELVVDVHPGHQIDRHVDLATIEESLQEATSPPPSGTLRAASFEGLGVLDGGHWDPEELLKRRVYIDDRSPVSLDQIANIRRSRSEESLRTRIDGDHAVLVTIHRAPNAHALRIADDAHRIVDSASRSDGLDGIDATILFDDSQVTRSAIQSVIVATVGGCLLAILLLFFALKARRRDVPLVGFVVFTSLSAAIIVLGAAGQTLNLLTLAGLLLSVGLGLDYAIIYLDRLDRLSGRSAAAIDAMIDVAGPLFGALLTTLAAVLPFLLVEGMVALLFRPLILTVVVCALTSFAFALVLLPCFASRKPSGEEVTTPAASSGPRWIPLRWGLTAALLAVLWWGFTSLPFEVLPVVDDGFVEVRATHPAGITAAQMDELTTEISEALSAVNGTETVFSTSGGYFREGLPSFRPGTANFMVHVDTDQQSSAAWADMAREAVDDLGIPQLDLSVTLPRIRGVQTRLSDSDLVVVLTRDDGDLLALGEVEGEVADALGEVEGLIDISRLRSGVSPRWKLVLDHEELARHDLRPADVSRVFQYALDGRVLRERMDGGEPLALRARFDRSYAGSPHQLEDLQVLVSSAGGVPLGQLGEFRFIEEPTHIERREGQRVVRIAGAFDPAGPGARATADAVEDRLDDLDLPDGVSFWLEGEVEALEETSRTFLTALLLALLMVLTLLLLQYGSLSFAASGLLTIPLCAAGSLLLLMVLGRPLDAMVLAGLLIATGIVANNVILVLSQAQTLAQESDTISLPTALNQAARERLRPIVLTAASTVLGMSPLLLGGAEVFGLLQPLAIALTGALLISIPVACFLLPGIATTFAPSKEPDEG